MSYDGLVNSPFIELDYNPDPLLRESFDWTVDSGLPKGP